MQQGWSVGKPGCVYEDAILDAILGGTEVCEAVDSWQQRHCDSVVLLRVLTVRKFVSKLRILRVTTFVAGLSCLLENRDT